jgi:hypothetical protein
LDDKFRLIFVTIFERNYIMARLSLADLKKQFSNEAKQGGGEGRKQV